MLLLRLPEVPEVLGRARRENSFFPLGSLLSGIGPRVLVAFSTTSVATTAKPPRGPLPVVTTDMQELGLGLGLFESAFAESAEVEWRRA